MGKKEFRLQKVGLALYKKLLEFAKVAGVHYIILDTPSVALVSHGIIGSSDLDQAGKVKAGIMTALMVKVTYNFIHTGKYRSKFMQKRFKKQMEDPNPYNRAFVAMTGIDRYDMSFITKESLKNGVLLLKKYVCSFCFLNCQIKTLSKCDKKRTLIRKMK